MLKFDFNEFYKAHNHDPLAVYIIRCFLNCCALLTFQIITEAAWRSVLYMLDIFIIITTDNKRVDFNLTYAYILMSLLLFDIQLTEYIKQLTRGT